MNDSSDAEVLQRIALLIGLLFAAGWAAVAHSPKSSAVIGLGLLALCAVVPLLAPRGAWVIVLALIGGVGFAVAHAAETARAAYPAAGSVMISDLLDTSFLTRPSVWFPAVLGIPLLVAVAGASRAVRASVTSVREVMRRQHTIAEMLVREDPESGTLVRRHVLPAAEGWIRLAQRYKIPLTFALVGVDVPPELDAEREGAAVLARAVGGYLRETLRDTDIVGRYDDYSFLLVVPGTDLIGGRSLVGRTLLEASRRATRMVRGCVVQYLVDGTTLDELLAEAEAGLELCRQGGMRIADRQLLAPHDGTSAG